MKAIKDNKLQDIGHQPLGQNFRPGNMRICTYKYTYWHTFRQSPTHFLCVSCKTVFSSFSSVRRGSVGLMTFPMRHKHRMWEADSDSARVCMWKPLCIYVWVFEELDTLFFMHLLEASCVFTSLCFWETSHAHLLLFLWQKVMRMFMCSQEECTSSPCWEIKNVWKNKFVSEELYTHCCVWYDHVCLWDTCVCACNEAWPYKCMQWDCFCMCFLFGCCKHSYHCNWDLTQFVKLAFSLSFFLFFTSQALYIDLNQYFMSYEN